MNIDSSNGTSSPSPAPQDEPVVSASNTPAENYIESELKKARVGLRRTQIIGILLLVVIGGQLGYITMRFRQSLQPHVAAEIADGIIVQQVNDRGPELAEEIKRKIPEYLAQTPDYVLEQLPVYREAVEDKVETTLTQYCDSTSQQLAKHVDTYLDSHQNEIKGMLTAPEDPETLQQTAHDMRQELMSYLKEKPEKGESIQTQLDQSLASLKEFEKKMHRLAMNKNLTPQEKKTRQVIAVLSKSINDQNMGEKAQALANDVKSLRQ